jgi:hypothetical protein
MSALVPLEASYPFLSPVNLFLDTENQVAISTPRHKTPVSGFRSRFPLFHTRSFGSQVFLPQRGFELPAVYRRSVYITLRRSQASAEAGFFGKKIV